MAGLGLSRSMRFTWALAREAFSAESAEPGFSGLAVDASAIGIEFVGFDEPARWSPPLAAVVSVGIAATAVPFVSSFGPVSAAPMQAAMAAPTTATASSRSVNITVFRGHGPETMQVFSDGGKLRGFMPGTGEAGDISKILPNGARIQGAPGTPFAGSGLFLHNPGGGGHFQKLGPTNLFAGNSVASARAFAQANVNVNASAKAEVIEKVRIRLRGVRSEAERLNIISAAAVSTGFSFGDVYYASASMPVAAAAPTPPPPPPAPLWRPAPPPPVAHHYPHRPHYAHHYHYRPHRVHIAAASCCCCCCCVPVTR